MLKGAQAEANVNPVKNSATMRTTIQCAKAFATTQGHDTEVHDGKLTFWATRVIRLTVGAFKEEYTTNRK